MEQNQDEPKSLLDDLRSHHVVVVHNPLTRIDDKRPGDFTWKVGRSVPANDPRFQDPVMKQLNMRNADHPTLGQVTQTITIPSGTTMKLPGDVAQVVVRHLVKEIMSRAGQKALISNVEARREVEEQVILNVNDLRSELTTMNIQEQLDKQLSDLNQEEPLTGADNAGETAFPTLEPGGAGDREVSEANPPAGTGVSFTPGQKTAAAK